KNGQSQIFGLCQLALCQLRFDLGFQLMEGGARQITQEVLVEAAFGIILGSGARSRFQHGAIAAALENQRMFVGVVERHHFADEYLMVPTSVTKGGAALETGGAAAEQRNATRATFELQRGKLVRTTLGEQLRQRTLVGG